MIVKRIKDISKSNKISMHFNFDDPDLNRSYYFFMKYLRRNKNVIPLKEGNMIVKNLYQLFFDIIDNIKNLKDPIFIQRVFSEIYKILRLKLRFYRGSK